MQKVRVAAFSVSIDGFAAGPDQSLEHPLGVGGMALHDWAFATRTFQRQHDMPGAESGSTGVDDDFAAASFENVGAWVMGRNMFGPVRGPWPDESWRGWWGENPVYHCPVFVLTHYPRAPLVMAGGTTFHFVTAGVEVAIARAREAAAGRDVRVGGGASVIRQCLERRLIDEMHLAIAPVLLGRGEPLFHGLDLPGLGYACARHVATSAATHAMIGRSAAA
jgi:dihydrofolate reductase